MAAANVITENNKTYYRISTYGDLGDKAYPSCNDKKCITNKSLRDDTLLVMADSSDAALNKCVKNSDVPSAYISSSDLHEYTTGVKLNTNTNPYTMILQIWDSNYPSSGSELTIHDRNKKSCQVSFYNISAPYNSTYVGNTSSYPYTIPSDNSYISCDGNITYGIENTIGGYATLYVSNDEPIKKKSPVPSGGTVWSDTTGYEYVSLVIDYQRLKPGSTTDYEHVKIRYPFTAKINVTFKVN